MDIFRVVAMVLPLLIYFGIKKWKQIQDEEERWDKYHGTDML
jgi:hypothetical protein